MTTGCDIAVVVGASGGIGAALVDGLRARGRAVIGLSRSGTDDARIDLTDEDSIALAAARVRHAGHRVTCLICAAGILAIHGRGPERRMADLDPGWLAQVMAVNAIGPALLAKHFLPMMPRDGRTVAAFLSARIGSIADNRLGGWYGYRASKAALNQFVRCLAVEAERTHPDAVILALHPGTVETTLSRPFLANVPAGRLFRPTDAADRLLDVMDAAEPAMSGRLYDYRGIEIAP